MQLKKKTKNLDDHIKDLKEETISVIIGMGTSAIANIIVCLGLDLELERTVNYTGLLSICGFLYGLFSLILGAITTIKIIKLRKSKKEENK